MIIPTTILLIAGIFFLLWGLLNYKWGYDKGWDECNEYHKEIDRRVDEYTKNN